MKAQSQFLPCFYLDVSTQESVNISLSALFDFNLGGRGDVESRS